MRKKMLLLLMTGWTAAYGADYNIVDYGAKPDTTILCTAALQQAIDDCSRAGGGRPHQGGIQAGQLTEIADSIADEKERSYPEATMWGSRNMLTQKVVGYQSESTTIMEASGDCYAGLFCSGKQFRGIGICQDGIFIESEGQRQIIQSGHYQRLWLRITNNSLENTHQFAYSTDGQRFVSAGSAFSMHSGYWKGIRVGLFCYGNDGKAQFDVFSQKVSH